MRIEGHAVDNYIKRVLKLSDGQAGESVVRIAEEQILLAVVDPDIIYKDPSKGSPIHIRNGCAVPVKDDGERYIPTTYNAGTFLSKIERRDRDARAIQA